MEALIDELTLRVEIPEPTHTEMTTASTEKIQAGPSRFVTASNQEITAFDGQKYQQKHTQVHQYVGKKV